MRVTRGKTAITALVGVLVFAWSAHHLWTSFQWQEIAGVLKTARFGSFAVGAVVTTLLYWALRAWRWQVLLSVVGNETIHVRSLYMSTACSLAFALVTPFQSGEMLKVELLRRQGGLGRFDGYASFAVERFLDLLVVLSLALVGVLLDPRWGLSAGLLGLLMVAMISGAAAVLWWSRQSKVLSHRLNALRSRFALISAQPGRLLFAVILTLAAWLVVALGWAWCLACVGIHLPAMQAVTLTTGMTLVNVLSFIPGAVGVSEAGIAVALGHLGHAATLAQSGALMIRAYGLAALVLGAMHFFLWPSLPGPSKRA